MLVSVWSSTAHVCNDTSRLSVIQFSRVSSVCSRPTACGLTPCSLAVRQKMDPCFVQLRQTPDRQRIASDQAQRQRSMSPALCWGSHVGNGSCEGRPLCCRRPIHLPRYRATYESAEKPAGDGWLVSDSQQLFCQFKPDMETAHEQWVPPCPPVSDPPADAQGQRDRSLEGDAETGC